MSKLHLILLATLSLAGQSRALLAQPESADRTRRLPPVADRWAALPTDRLLRNEGPTSLEQLSPAEQLEDSTVGSASLGLNSDQPQIDLTRLLRPRFELVAEWEPEADGVAVHSYDFSAQMPIYPIFGPPPPSITTGYSLTQFDAPSDLDLPNTLHEFSLGMGWMRKINETWMARFMLSGAFASDLENTSGDAWRLRGGGFALYRPNEKWNFAFGALATGRTDIPVIPAVGAIWDPSPNLRLNLMMPDPKISVLVLQNESRQHWLYLGGAMSGGNWAYDRANGLGERLNYREWRLLLGWEWLPTRTPGSFRPTGTRLMAEVGYVLGRKIEFDNDFPSLSLGNSLILRAGTSF